MQRVPGGDTGCGMRLVGQPLRPCVQEKHGCSAASLVAVASGRTRTRDDGAHRRESIGDRAKLRIFRSKPLHTCVPGRDGPKPRRLAARTPIWGDHRGDRRRGHCMSLRLRTRRRVGVAAHRDSRHARCATSDRHVKSDRSERARLFTRMLGSEHCRRIARREAFLAGFIQQFLTMSEPPCSLILGR